VVGEVSDVDPLPPALGGLPHLVGGLFVGLRRRVFGPAQGDEHVVALFHPGARPRLPALQPDAQVGGQAQRRMRVGLFAGARDGLAVGVGRVLPGDADAVVVEGRFAAHHQLDRAADAAHGAQQDVLGVPVHRGAAMRSRAALDVVPRAHHQRVTHDQPPGVGLPGGLHDQAAGKVAARRRHRDAVGAEPKVAGAAVQDRAEHARGVGPGHAQPFHRPGGGDQARRLPVGQECVVGDRREGVPQRAAGRERRRRAEVDRRSQRRFGRSFERFQRCLGGSTVGRLVGGLGVQDHADIIDCQPARRPMFPLGVGVRPARVASPGNWFRVPRRIGWAG
jgi:hypothetical protein